MTQIGIVEGFFGPTWSNEARHAWAAFLKKYGVHPTKLKETQDKKRKTNKEKYTIENTKAIKDQDGNIISEAVGNVELCVIEEFILRYFNEVEENNKKWFFTPEMAIYHKLYTIFV